MRISPDKTSCQGRHTRIAINGVRNKESDIQLLVEKPARYTIGVARVN